MNLSKRSLQKELLDEDNIPFEDIRQNMKELNTINTLLGGHAITIEGVKRLVGTKQEITICEIGCGGGDNLFAISKWAAAKKLTVKAIGIDYKPECISFAKQQQPQGNYQWITSNYMQVQFQTKPDIIFSSLFCHHFQEKELVEQLQWMKENSMTGFFINDLQRHWLAYWSIKILTASFSRSYLVKNDAPLSVARSFRKTDWELLLKEAAIANASIDWKWAFRYLIVYGHG